MDIERLALLKEALLASEDFHAVMNRFHRDIAADPDLYREGQDAEPGLLGPALTQIARQLFGGSARVEHLTLLRLREHLFVHGYVQLGGRPGNVFFFEDVQVGLACIVQATGRVEYFRFRASATPYLPSSNSN